MRTRPEYDFKVIGKNLRKLRIRQHLTVEDVREYMQLGTVQAVYKWERGESLPQADSLLALMELYQVHSVDMLVGESEMLSPVVFYRCHRMFTHQDSILVIEQIFVDFLWLSC